MIKNTELPILFQDQSLIVVSKAAGMIVHRSKIDSRETKFAMQTLRGQLGFRVYPVPRLDKATSGALMFATSPEIAKEIGEEFLNSRINKKYLAIIRGRLAEDALVVDYPLKEIPDKKTDSKARLDKAPQSARTQLRMLATCEIQYQVDRYQTSRYSLIEANPITGRKHQIRRHLKHLSHPIIGDVNYGSGVHNKFFRHHYHSHRLLLACTELSFTHPVTKKQICVPAPLDQSFLELIEKLGMNF